MAPIKKPVAPAKPVQICATTPAQLIKWLTALPRGAKLSSPCSTEASLCMKYDPATKTVSVAECLVPNA